MVEHLPGMYKALSSVLSAARNNSVVVSFNCQLDTV